VAPREHALSHREAEENGGKPTRAALIRNIEAHSGVHDDRVLRAFERVPRHLFVRPHERPAAYQDTALPIGFEQTISQPSMIAIMLNALQLEPSHRVLEIGAGSGYAAALLAQLVAQVYALEIVPELADEARARLGTLGYSNVEIVNGNGRLGLPEHAPYDRILVSAGADRVPPELVRELAPGGRIAIPVGDELAQQLIVGQKDERGEITWEPSIPCIFVPLVGRDAGEG
jgi:protein-L-isoaspartate(D-aspartate) O-methyltransferase